MEPGGLMQLFKRLSSAMQRTRDNLSGRMRELAGTGRRVDESMLESLEDILLEADLGWQTAESVVKEVREQIKHDAQTPVDQLVEQILLEQLKVIEQKSVNEKAMPQVILVVGVNGAGKTTTIGKLAARLKSEGKKVMVAAGDTFRAAAIEQLEVWVHRAGVDFVKSHQGADPAALAFDALSSALNRGHDVLIIDTAGRLHNKRNLMLELQKIHRVLAKLMPDAPHEVLLVLDGTTGQNALSQAKLFSEATGVSGLVLTKLDGTARGGIAIAIHQELGLPVQWIGVGEGMEDLQAFDATLYVRALFEGLQSEDAA
jgi:fused signal recognition particle receptor